MALLVSWFFAAGLINIRFAFADITESDVRSLKRVEGEWLYISHRRSGSECIVSVGTEAPLACFGGGPSVTRTGPHSRRKPATGYVYPGGGIVQMDVDGVTVLTVHETQAYFRRQAYIFLSLIGFAAMMVAYSVGRQIYLVKHQGETA
jgi:hypothetical protein